VTPPLPHQVRARRAPDNAPTALLLFGLLSVAACSASSADDAADASHAADAPQTSHDATKPADAKSSHDAHAAIGSDGGSHKDAGIADAADASPAVDAGPCPAGMIYIATYCIDTWEAYVVELDDAGAEHPHSPYDIVDGLTVRAKTAAHVVPQGYISQIEATAACSEAGKRLCSEDEFHLACEGPDASNYYPYGGETDIPGYCNEGKGSYVELLYGDDPSDWTYDDFNDPRLNQIDGGLAATQSYPHCKSPYGLYDCMGNLHEWGSDPADSEGHGRFRGGFYGDAEENGPGCLYVTSAHELAYHDYSTGFRCCADPKGTD
jgi:sulfatase modifying factor 1